MHEFSLVQALLKQVDTLRREQNAGRVVSIQVSVGEFSGVEPELFREAYKVLIEETPMRGAALQMDCEPLRGRCENCGRDFAIHRFRFECPDCFSRGITIVSGEGLVLESVTMEQEENVGRISDPSWTV
jgi:hydrogenase nickel incorporation protein HypA/HybF